MQINPGWFRQRFTLVQINVYDSISEMSGCVKYQLLTLNTSRVWLAPAKGSLCGFVLQIWRQTGKRQVPGALVPALNLISSLENKIRTCSITEPVGGCNNLNCHTPTDCYPLYVKSHKSDPTNPINLEISLADHLSDCPPLLGQVSSLAYGSVIVIARQR